VPLTLFSIFKHQMRYDYLFCNFKIMLIIIFYFGNLVSVRLKDRLILRPIPLSTGGWSKWRHIKILSFFRKQKFRWVRLQGLAKVREDFKALRALREELTIHPPMKSSHRQWKLNPRPCRLINSLSIGLTHYQPGQPSLTRQIKTLHRPTEHIVGTIEITT